MRRNEPPPNYVPKPGLDLQRHVHGRFSRKGKDNAAVPVKQAQACAMQGSEDPENAEMLLILLARHLQKQISCGNDRQKGKSKNNRRSFDSVGSKRSSQLRSG